MTASKAKAAAEAAADEGTGAARTITFGSGDDAVSFEVPRKWKRFKFMRALARNDMAGCLDSIWPPSKEKDRLTGEMVEVPHPIVAEIEELEITDEDFQAAFEALGHALGGTSAGNSESSPA